MRYRCWEPDSGQTREEAVDLDALDEREAAELYAERQFTGSDPFNSMTVRVAAWGAGSSNAFDVEVDVRCEPVFCGARPVRVDAALAEKEQG